MSRVLNKGLIKLIVFLIIISTPVYASNNYEDTNILDKIVITPYFTNISVFTNTFEISSSGKASVSSYLTARSIDNLKIEVNLEQFKDGNWTTLKSWTKSSKGINGGLSGSHYLIKGYIYRAVSKAMVYKNGVLLESTSNISKMKNY